MARLVLIVLLVVAVVLGAFAALRSGDDSEMATARADLLLPASAASVSGFSRATKPYAWRFPDDHGPHPEFQTEWWYYTGNVVTDTGRRFGYQFTVFRRAATPERPASDSEWRTNQLYMAHFTVTDVEDERFFQAQRFSRGAAGLAGATSEPRYRAWLEDWEIFALDAQARHTAITAASGEVRIQLELEQVKPPALNGDRGLSQKSDYPGNASYYYSLSRLATHGTVTIEGETFAVSGTSWMDHEFSTSALSAGAQGWDWFGLQFDDGRELMVGQIRLVGGGIEPAFGGLLILPDGSTRLLDSSDFSIEPAGSWTSPHTGTTYPAGWAITVMTGDPTPLTLTVTPLVADQELIEGAIIYWEGAVRVTGDATGYGYAELTGYESAMRQRF
jgi:predicted secreted hydrolase